MIGCKAPELIPLTSNHAASTVFLLLSPRASIRGPVAANSIEFRSHLVSSRECGHVEGDVD